MVADVDTDLPCPLFRRGFAGGPVNGVDDQTLNRFNLKIFGMAERCDEDFAASLVLPRPRQQAKIHPACFLTPCEIRMRLGISINKDWRRLDSLTKTRGRTSASAVRFLVMGQIRRGIFNAKRPRRRATKGHNTSQAWPAWLLGIKGFPPQLAPLLQHTVFLVAFMIAREESRKAR